MTTEDYNQWNIAVQIGSAIISAIVGLVVWRYTVETKKLRLATDNQLTLARDQAKQASTPFLMPTYSHWDALPNGLTEPGGFPMAGNMSGTLSNASDTPAIHAHLMLAQCSKYYISRITRDCVIGLDRTIRMAAMLGPLDPLQLRQALEQEFRDVPERLFATILNQQGDFIFAICRNPKGDLFLTGRSLTIHENAPTQNWSVTALYP